MIFSSAQDNCRKRHIAVDTEGLLLLVWVIAASVVDRYGGLRLMVLLREKWRPALAQSRSWPSGRRLGSRRGSR
jgi:hypothetical protein